MRHQDIYIQLTSLPLLQGINAEDLLMLQEREVLRMVSIEPDEGNVINRGQQCKTLIMLMQGSLQCQTIGDGWTLAEELHAPAMIEEEALWSLSQTYHRNYRPLCEGKLLVINRGHVMQTLMRNEVFRMNLLARMASRLEKYMIESQTTSNNNINHKILSFVRKCAYTNSMPKTMNIKMKRLAEIVEETRLNVSKALHEMELEGIVSIAREEIIINRFYSE